jgi:lipoate-protein ligase A
MRLQPDVSLFSQVFGEELIPVQLPLSEGGDDLIATVIEVLTAAACRCLEIELEVQPLSEEEWQAIADVEGRRKKEEGKYIRYPTS